MINGATANQMEPNLQLAVLSVRGWICHEVGAGDRSAVQMPPHQSNTRPPPAPLAETLWQIAGLGVMGGLPDG